MKLAEALLERKRLKPKIESLQSRLSESVMVQEGDKPVEDPQVLMAELNEATDALETLIKQINATNNVATLPDGVPVSEANPVDSGRFEGECAVGADPAPAITEAFHEVGLGVETLRPSPDAEQKVVPGALELEDPRRHGTAPMTTTQFEVSPRFPAVSLADIR